MDCEEELYGEILRISFCAIESFGGFERGRWRLFGQKTGVSLR